MYSILCQWCPRALQGKTPGKDPWERPLGKAPQGGFRGLRGLSNASFTWKDPSDLCKLSLGVFPRVLDIIDGVYCMVSIQERFVLKSGLWWRAFSRHMDSCKNGLWFLNLIFSVLAKNEAETTLKKKQQELLSEGKKQGGMHASEDHLKKAKILNREVDPVQILLLDIIGTPFIGTPVTWPISVKCFSRNFHSVMIFEASYGIT